MTTSLADLLAQREALERQIRDAQTSKRAEAIAEIRKLMSEHGLTSADLSTVQKKLGVKQGGKVAPKYRDPATGATWTGRGLKPKWLSAALAQGKSVADFAV